MSMQETRDQQAMSTRVPVAVTNETDPSLSLYHLLDPEVLADPYPLYRQLREEDPVHWDPFLHAWVVTRYADVVTVLERFSADRTPTPDQLAAMGMAALGPIAQVMVRQMLFLDPPRTAGFAAWPRGRSPPAGLNSFAPTSRRSWRT